MTTNTHRRLKDIADIEIALHQLNNRITDGMDFPEACWQVSCRWNSISYEALSNAYDAQFE